MFNKKGTTEKILSVIKGIDKKAMRALVCTKCQALLSVCSDGDLVVGVENKDSSVTVLGGKMIIECKKCGHKNIV